MMRKAEGTNFPEPVARADRIFADDETLEIDGLTIVTREIGKAEANSTTVYYVPATRDLYVGDLVLDHLDALFGDAASSECLAALDRLDVLFPDARIVHPGHGVSGPKGDLLADQRAYIAAARAIVATTIVERGDSAEAEAEAARRLRIRFPYENPSGLPDIVAVSVHGLFAEFAKPGLRPVR